MDRVYAGCAAVIGCGLLMLGAAAVLGGAVPLKAPKMAVSTVFIHMGDEGHGSGVNIGDGYVLTAAHVADHTSECDDGDKDCTPGPLPLRITDSRGKDHAVEVLWANHHYDIALLRMADAKNVEVSPLSCRFLDRGEKVSMRGNPLNLRDVTTYGQIANPNIAESGPWKAINVVSGALVPGMSGGPTFDHAGNVVGINVGIQDERTPIADKDGNIIGANQMGFAVSFIVPGRAICNLMDRS